MSDFSVILTMDLTGAIKSSQLSAKPKIKTSPSKAYLDSSGGATHGGRTRLENAAAGHSVCCKLVRWSLELEPVTLPWVAVSAQCSLLMCASMSHQWL